MEPYVVVAVVVVALLILLWWGRKRSISREKAIIVARTSDMLENFIASFRPEVRPIASALYAELQNHTSTGQFPFRKTDNIAQVLRVDKIDLEDALTQVTKQFGCRKPSQEDDSMFRGRGTFEEYVEFIHYLKPT